MTLLKAPARIDRPANDLLAQSLALMQLDRPDRYIVSVDQYTAFRRDGFLIVPGLVSPEQTAQLRQHTEDLMQGRLPEQTETFDDKSKPSNGVHIQGLGKPPEHLSPEQKAEYWLRIHMLHRVLEIHERFLLHPRIIDVLEAIIGPDVLAMQSMLFLKGPGQPGQGFHQDSYYIPTYPDSLCGAWLAIDDVDEENGCMYFTPGSNHEPVYPPVATATWGFGDAALSGIERVGGVSDTDDAKNDLVRIAARKFGVTKRGTGEVAAIMKAGDVAFFGGHVFHRSFTNQSKTRFRRSFVGHYCNARAYTDWGGHASTENPHHATADPETGATNCTHILARGDTHLAYAKPRFNTPCAALIPPETRRLHRRPGASMMGMPSGQMAPSAHGSDHDHEKTHAQESKSGY